MSARTVVWAGILFAYASVAAAKDLSVAEFGAVADGKTDATAAIQKALDAAGQAGGGRVIIPPAERPYLVTKTIRVAFGNIELLAEGATLQMADNAVAGGGTHVLHVTGTKQKAIAGVTGRGLGIDANFWNQQTALEKKWKPRGILVTHAQKVLLDRVHVRRAWVSLAFAEGAEDSEARACTVTEWHNDGFDAANGARKILFSDCRAHHAFSERKGGPPGSRDDCWEIEDGAQEITLLRCVVEDTDAKPFSVRSHDTPTVLRDIRLIGCRFSTQAERGGCAILGRDFDTRTEDVLMEDCQVPGTLYCVGPADRVKIVGGRFGEIRVDCPRRIEIVGSTIGKLTIRVVEQSDGKETYRPQVILEKVKLAEPPESTGDAGMVKTVE